MSEAARQFAAEEKNGACGEALLPKPAEPAAEQTPWLWLALLTALAAVLRAIALNQQLWYDEILTLLDSVRQPLGTIVTTYAQNQHALYSVLARISILLLGDQAWTLRLPAVLFGVLTVPALYFCARLLASRREALLACAMLTVSYHHVWFSQNARGYTGLVFFALLATYFFIRGMQNQRWSEWFWYGLMVALGGYIHLIMGFIAVGHGLVYVWLLAARARQLRALPRKGFQPMAGFSLAAGFTFLIYLPALPDVFQVTSAQAATRWSDPVYFVVETLRGLGAGAGGGLVAVLAGGLILLVGLVSLWRSNRYLAGLMVAPGMVTGIAMLFLAHQQPRFFFFAIGFALLLLMRGATAVTGWIAQRLGRSEQTGLQWGTALVALMLAASCYQLRAAYYPKQDFVGAMAFVETQRKRGDVVAAAGLAWEPYQRYYQRDWPVVKNPEELAAVRAKGQRVWLLYTLPVFDRWVYPELRKSIQAEFTTVRVFRGTLSGGEVVVCRAEAR